MSNINEFNEEEEKDIYQSIELYYSSLEKVFDFIRKKACEFHRIPHWKEDKITWEKIQEYLTSNTDNSLYIEEDIDGILEFKLYNIEEVMNLLNRN